MTVSLKEHSYPYDFAVVHLVHQSGGEFGRKTFEIHTVGVFLVNDPLPDMNALGNRGQMRYAEFQAQGYPIGSGAVESANKLVIEARPKGGGMHWACHNATPMVALRALAYGDR